MEKVKTIPCSVHEEHEQDKEIELMKSKGECLIDIYRCNCGVTIEEVFYVEKVGTRLINKDNTEYSEDWN